MEEIHETAKAYYNNLTENQKQNAYYMFLLMDLKGDGSVSISKYVEILGKMGFKSCNNPKFFMELDRDGDGNLDFQEFLSLYYLIKSNRLVFCHGHGCGAFLREVYITCLRCLYGRNKNAFNLCQSCFDGKSFRHNHATFMAFKNQESARMKANWSELQTEILELILEKLTKNLSFKLTVINIDRFKAVCSSWKKAAKSFTSSPSYTPPPQAPWLMLLTKQLDHFGGHFINVAANNNTVHHDLNNMFKGGYLVGASYGWLAILNQITMIPHLLNPFSSTAEIQLPLMKSGMINTLVLSSDPCRTKGFIVAVIYSLNYNNRLAFCKHGDETWTEMYKDESYRNIAFRNDQIYAISEKYTVDIWDCQTSLFPTEVVRIGNLYRMTIKWLSTKNMRCDLRRSYLVESLGELLIVERMAAYCFPCYTTFGFVICKLDNGAEGGCTSLQTLTDRALFIGDKEAISVSIRDFPNLKENSIYFMENYLKVYSLEDDKLSMCDCNTGVYLQQVTSFWMVPNPW